MLYAFCVRCGARRVWRKGVAGLKGKDFCWLLAASSFMIFLTFPGALGGHFGTLLAPGVALGLLERIFGQFRLSIVTFGVAFWCLWGPLWPTLAAFGLRLGALWQTFGSFEGHFGYFVEAFWRLLATFYAVLGELLEKS